MIEVILPVLVHGDCLEVMAALPNACVDMVFADLPYGCTANHWDSLVDLSALWLHLNRVCLPGAAIVFTCQQPFTTAIINSNQKAFRYDLIWVKNRKSGMANASRAPLRSHETILVFGAKNVFNPQMTKIIGPYRKYIKSGSNPKKNQNTNMAQEPNKIYHRQPELYPTSVLAIDRDDLRNGCGHPTQKPVALLQWLIKTYTHPGQLVLDPTAGSMTTAIGAMNTARRSICIEQDEQYFANGQARVKKNAERIEREGK